MCVYLCACVTACILQVSIIVHRRVIRGKEPEFEAALARMCDFLVREVNGSAGTSFIRPHPGDKHNEYLVPTVHAQLLVRVCERLNCCAGHREI